MIEPKAKLPQVRLYGEELAACDAQMCDLARSGFNAAEISRMYGIGYARVWHALYRLGVSVNREPQALAQTFVGPLGAIKPLLASQSPAFRQWLRDNLPEGGTVGELLVSMAVDTYQDELESKQAEGTTP